MQVEKTRLDNGINLITHTMPHLESASLGVWVRSGSRYETKKQHGISHLLEHMAFKGTKRRSARAIAEEIEATGGDINAATSVENTCYYARILKDDAPLALDLISDILLNARFEEKELKREQNVIVQEISAALDNPEDLVFDSFQDIAYKDQSIGRTILGTKQAVQSFSAQQLKQFLQAQYQPQDMIIAAAGALSHDKFASSAAQAFAVLKPLSQLKSPPAPARYTGGRHHICKDLLETHMILGFEGCSYCHEDYYAIQLLANILGGGMASRLFQEVRERYGLCYSIYAFHWGFSDTGLFGIQAATSQHNVAKLMPVILDTLLHICGNITQAEIERARAQVRAGLLMVLENPAARASQLAHHMLIFGRIIDLTELVERINAITTQDLEKLAASLFINASPTLVSVGPPLSTARADKALCLESVKQRLDGEK